ncbi:serine/threonine-protein kinase BLUS1-like isoform X1 [Lycium barbarum]|uniref:serine/threonine-protein kinase BLUS1-like isoform X1 n=2 Tax=Lycium barbarum TaxID=112863 RepID=UPI00293EDC0B|nr:serine/threonine-protein kinase BLUS1-like isoform X1 [Lycium barbarum]XP_060180166.1 serine/threonine-protein kinase BLUS1-like isoform X1 [Lycium barbarum]XP_060180167.1 serine/threonine-protein kinase BLUS1-like isoform X1 [Lycium barbarum]XP_060180168.1 serine/threonine-protein kinase BLUS1-like isoform X1 [Lycium barbarum]
MGGGQKSNYSLNPKDYKLLEEVGYGASATVYRTIHSPSNEVVAVKCLDLDRCNSNLDDIRREAQTMSLIGHPNLIKAFCSFVVDHYLWVVMPFMAEGSCLHLMQIAYPDGFEEAVIGSILKETLKALEYLHQHGHIHRDVKAGNILLDTTGVVKLADFGVSACMFDSGDRQRSRNTFTGTPCWMAPEVLQPGTEYDFKADIWSFGITALELAHGHAPFSKYPPMKVLLMTINSAPPGLDYDRDKKFSKSFREMVAMCLVKDQTKRPTAERLLKHTFFKKVKPPELAVKKLFADLPSLWSRVKTLQLKDAAHLALKKMPSSEQEAISQSEYQRGVSAWNFDLEDLKFQASMVQDDDELPEIREEDESMKSYMNYKENSLSGLNAGKPSLKQDTVSSEQGSVGEVTLAELDPDYQEEGGLKKYSSKTELPPLTSDKDAVQAKSRYQTAKACRSQSGPLMPGVELSHSASERAGNFESRSKIENQQAERAHQVRRAPIFSGPLMLPNKASANSKSAPINSSGGLKDSSDDKSTANLVQIKGRFSVTSENVDLVKGSQLRKAASVGDWILESKQLPPSRIPKELGLDNIPASVLMPHLQNLFQLTSIQQDLIVNLLSSLQLSEAGDASQHGKSSPQCIAENNGSVDAVVSERERMLLVKISELQARMSSLTDELTAEKLKYMQLQQRLNGMSNQGEDWDRRESES